MYLGASVISSARWPRTLALMSGAKLDPYDCGCGWLERAAADPSVPIGFNPKVNEYYIEIKKGDIEVRMIIRFCPNCGGDAPVSTRRKSFSAKEDT